MRNLIAIAFVMSTCVAFAQIVPTASGYNEDVVWSQVFTQGPAGKVNRGIVDSAGDCVAVSMPEDLARVTKVNGENGVLVWTVTINNRVGFGICEIPGDGHPDYIVSGGAQNSQERWLTRLHGLTGEVMWDQVYSYPGGGGQYDGLRTVMVGSDGFLYASGFVQGDESDTIFVVYAGSSVVMKVDPVNGDVVWSSVNNASEYALATIQGPNGDLFSGGVMYDEGLSLTRRSLDGTVLSTAVLPNTESVIPYDLATGSDGQIYYGGHSPRQGAGFPYDYTCISLDVEGAIEWRYDYANPRGYSLNHIRNELYGLEAGTDGIYMFGGSGDESGYSATLPPFPSSDVWVGWVLHVDFEGEIVASDVFDHAGVNSATEYGALIEGGYVIFNDTDAGGDTEVGMIKILNGSNPAPNSCAEDLDLDGVVGISDVLLVLGEFGCTSSCFGDVDGDGLVNVADVLQMIAAFGSECS